MASRSPACGAGMRSRQTSRRQRSPRHTDRRDHPDHPDRRDHQDRPDLLDRLGRRDHRLADQLVPQLVALQLEEGRDFQAMSCLRRRRRRAPLRRTPAQSGSPTVLHQAAQRDRMGQALADLPDQAQAAAQADSHRCRARCNPSQPDPDPDPLREGTGDRRPRCLLVQQRNQSGPAAVAAAVALAASRRAARAATTRRPRSCQRARRCSARAAA